MPPNAQKVFASQPAEAHVLYINAIQSKSHAKGPNGVRILANRSGRFIYKRNPIEEPCEGSRCAERLYVLKRSAVEYTHKPMRQLSSWAAMKCYARANKQGNGDRNWNQKSHG